MRKMVLLVLLVVGTAACLDDVDALDGSGVVVSENRKVGEFDRVSVTGFGQITIEIGPVSPVRVEAEDNVLPHLVTEVRGSTLVVGSDRSFGTVVEPRYTVTVPELNGVTITGSGDVEVVGLDSDDLNVSIVGSGDVSAVGVTDRLNASITGSGTLYGEDLVVADAGVRIEGSGSAVVNATGSLDARVTGSGSITYLGDPVLNRSVVGSGSIAAG